MILWVYSNPKRQRRIAWLSRNPSLTKPGEDQVVGASAEEQITITAGDAQRPSVIVHGAATLSKGGRPITSTRVDLMSCLTARYSARVVIKLRGPTEDSLIA